MKIEVIMQLSEKIDLMSKDQTVAELKEMLNHSQVSVSWGSRLVSVDGYEGSVEINQIARKFLNALPRRDMDISLKKRLSCYELWGRIEKLYFESENLLKNTWITAYMVFFNEYGTLGNTCSTCTGDPRSIIHEFDDCGVKRGFLFEFTPSQFKKIWPKLKPKGAEQLVRWTATKKMIEDAALLT